MKLALMAAAGLGALMLPSCAVVSDLSVTGVAETIEQNATTLNEAHTKAMTAIIAVNVLRARDRWPTNYTTLSGIKSNPTMSLNSSANFTPLGLGNARNPFIGSSAALARNETANAEYSVNPFAQSDKTQSLLRPIQPDILLTYWDAGWPTETLMWVFVDSVKFPDVEKRWFINGDEFTDGASQETKDNTAKYVSIIKDARAGKILYKQLPNQSLDERNCKPYDPVYLRETLGGAGGGGGGDNPGLSGGGAGGRGGGGGGGGSMRDTINTVEELTGQKMILAPDVRPPKPGEPVIAPDKFNRKLLLCDTSDARWGFVDKDTGKVRAEIRTRSFDDMIYFLGETLRNASPGHPTPFDGVVLFNTYTARGDRKFAVRVEHAGQVYFIAPQSPNEEHDGFKDITGNVLSLLNQLYLYAQSDEFLRAPEARLR